MHPTHLQQQPGHLRAYSLHSLWSHPQQMAPARVSSLLQGLAQSIPTPRHQGWAKQRLCMAGEGEGVAELQEAQAALADDRCP